MNAINRARITLSSLLLVMTFLNAPAFAQYDFAGEWFPIAHEDQGVERRGGALLGDYTGIPVNDAARMRGDTYDASIDALPEWQCRPHSSDYIMLGISPLRISKEIDPVTQQFVAWRMHWLRSTVDRMIYMDGRPHPPEFTAHSWDGFSTAEWQGATLKVTTTHLKEYYINRNGIFRSSMVRVSEYFYMTGNYLTQVVIMYDPAYLTEPFTRSASYIRNPSQDMPAYPCPVVVEEVRPKGSVPHFLPGKNPYLTEFAAKTGLPPEATRGGAETLYPEYQLKLRELYKTPDRPAIYK